MKFIKTMALTLCCGALLCGCGAKLGDAIKVNDKVISKAEFYRDYDKLKEAQFKNLSKELQTPDSYLVLAFKSKYVNDIILKELLHQEFEKRKISATDEEIEAKKAQIIAQMGSKEKLDNVLKENSISEARFKEDLKYEVETLKLLDQLKVPEVTDKEAQKYYNENKSMFDMPERALVSHILIDTNPESIKRKIVDADKKAKLSSAEIEAKVKEETKKQQELLQKVLKEAKANPKQFAQLAQQYSQDETTAKNGGNLGYVIKGQLVPEFEKAAFSQKVGTVSEPVKTQFGEHIILVSDKAQKGLQPFSKVKEDLKKYIDQQNKIQALQSFALGLKDKSTIVFIDKTLDPAYIQKQMQESIKKQVEAAKKDSSSKGLEKIKK